MRWILALAFLVPAVWAGDVLPPEVRELQAKVAAAEGRLAAVRAELENMQGREKVADARLRQMVVMVMRARAFPGGFWLARDVLGQETLRMEPMVRQVMSELQQTRTRSQKLGQTYANLQERLAKAHEVRQVFEEARGRLRAREVAVLREAGLAVEEGMEVSASVVAGGFELDMPKPAAVNNTALAMPLVGRVVRDFGGKNMGVVLKALPAAAVKSVAAGEVLYSGPFRQFGGLVIVKDAAGRDILLGGMQSLNVNAGETVAVGQVLGTLGADGRLYWEVRRHGRAVDPLR